MIKKIAFNIVPIQIFLGIFWFKNGVVDKLSGVLLGIFSPETAYHGDTWAGWSGYIVGTWDKSEIGHVLLSPFFNYVFPFLIILQCIPVILVLKSIINGEFLKGKERPILYNAALVSLFITSIMAFTQTLTGASDGQYLWQLLGFGMITLMYIKNQEKI